MLDKKTPESSPVGSGTPLEDEYLVRKAQQGDHKAFASLYERYHDRILRYITSMIGDEGIGCELTQDTFLKAWEALPSLRDPTRLQSWIYRIATNCAYNQQQRAKRFHFLPWNHPSVTQLTSIQKHSLEDTELLQMALAQVSITYRPCFILYVLEEIPQKQIAQLLHMKADTVSKYVSRGREELREIYHRLLSDELPLSRRKKRFKVP